MDGDSGSMVLDAESGDVYGHIVAGDPNSNMAFIVPAYRVIEDIEMRFGHKPEFTLLPDALASESFIARASATLAIDAVRSSRRALDRLSTLSYYSNLCVVFLIGKELNSPSYQNELTPILLRRRHGDHAEPSSYHTAPILVRACHPVVDF